MSKTCEMIRGRRAVDVIAFENEECLLEDLRLRGLLNETRREITGYLESLNSEKLKDDDERDEKRSILELDSATGLLRQRNVVGVLIYGDLRLWIAPKILAGAPEDPRVGTLALLYHMAAYAEGYRRVASVIQLASEPLTALARPYVYVVSSKLKQGVYREYVRMVRESEFVRGKVVLREFLRRWPHSTHRLVVEDWQLSADTPLNRILYAAAERALTQDPSTRSRALEVLSLLEEAEELEHWIPRDIRAVKFNRLNERFREAFNLACLILGYAGLTGKDALIFVFNTPKLFEEYVCGVLSRELKEIRVRYQQEIRNGLLVNDRPRAVKPDVILHGKRKVPLEVKYKELKDLGEAPLPDVYQVAFYSRLLGSDRAILVYPMVAARAKHVLIEVRSSDEEDTLMVHVIGYDLLRSIKMGEIDREFLERVREVVEH